MSIILPAEWVGDAAHSADGVLRIGEGPNVVAIPLSKQDGKIKGWWNTGTVGVYVRRLSDTGEIAEIVMAQHDGLAVEAEQANPTVMPCPECSGEGCDACDQWGLVPTSAHRQPGIYQAATQPKE